jgi:hypothetical protein
VEPVLSLPQVSYSRLLKLRQTSNRKWLPGQKLKRIEGMGEIWSRRARLGITVDPGRARVALTFARFHPELPHLAVEV